MLERKTLSEEEQKKLNSILVVLVSLLLLAAIGLILLDDKGEPATSEEPAYTRHQINTGDVFDLGGYMLLGDLEFLYTGVNCFDVTNTGTQFARVTAEIVGVKISGDYELLQIPSFGGVDKTQYEKDLEENGWAIKNLTNVVRPGETLHAELSVFDFHAHDSDLPDADIDGDGYWDIIFRAHMQDNDTSYAFSIDDPVSGIYKLPKG